MRDTEKDWADVRFRICGKGICPEVFVFECICCGDSLPRITSKEFIHEIRQLVSDSSRQLERKLLVEWSVLTLCISG